MQVTSPGAGIGAAAASDGATAKSSSLDYQSFLTLLVAQLKNQDPTKPADGTEFIAQLASFSNVEQAIQTNAKLDAILNATAINNVAGLIGRIVTSPDGKVSGMVTSVELAAPHPIARLADGREVPLTSGVKIG